jgi:type IV pilus assembly protein PilY1
MLPVVATLAVTLASAPGRAITIPSLPLQTGTAYPPANVMFILDDSGSMVFEKMPDDGASPLSTNISDKSYANNTIYYNPNQTYLPWMTASGTRLTGGTSFTAAYADLSLASSAIDLSSTSSCKTVDRNGDNRSICGGVQTFFVPKTGVTDYTRSSNFDQYQIFKVGGAVHVVKGTTTATLASDSWNDVDLAKKGSSGDAWSGTLVVPAGATSFTVTAKNGSGGNADLYVRLNSAPTTSTYDGRSHANNNTESVTITDPGEGTWYIGVFNASNSSSVSNEDIAATATGYVIATPTGRSESDEIQNYATWFSYHRTRIKVAKAGASEAFGQLGSGIRVGYDSIWNRNSTNWAKGTSVSKTASPAYKVPVGTDDGLFRSTNRAAWFDQLQGARGYNGTPLQGALQRSGRYFESTSSSGPWGPGSDDQLSCRQNFSILTTDGYWNSDEGYDDDDIGDSDSEQGEVIVSEDEKTSIQYKPITPYKDNFKKTSHGSTVLYSGSDTLADVANYYWKRDLVTGLANDVPTSTADPAFWQHMVTFGVSIGLQGRLNPKTDLQSITNGSKNWGDPTDAEDLDRIDDLWHASVNGHGNFVTATNPTEFVQGLIDALATVAQRLGSASNVTANSTSFQTDTRVYQASYVSGKWTGELAAYEVSAAGISTVDADGDGIPDAAWKASDHIPAYPGRKIFTWSGSVGTGFPTSSQSTDMAQPVRADINGGITTGAENAAYIAGSQAKEIQNGGKLRDRDVLLGDIANSSPMYVKESETIYVGANDGMLHGFNALTGAELFAYVPAGISFTDLGTLSDPQYSPSHRYFVDGPVVVSSTSQTPGKNYLVGSLGRGGRGVYGLDVTTPTSFGNGSVLWDKTGTALGNDMGQVLGEPLIATLNAVDEDGDKVLAAIVSNGINSPNGHSVLFVLNLKDGSLIARIDTGVGSDNGLSAPRGADTDGDGDIDNVYAGDLKGNVWKFDLSSSTISNWAIANSGEPMFTAVDSAGKAQPITAGLAIARDPATSKVWVFVGTGSFMTSADVSNTDVQSMYGLIDDGAAIDGRDDLVARDIIVVATADGKDVRGFESSGTMPPDKRGWYVDLDDPSPGERVVSNPRVRGIVLLFASMIPPQENTCDAGGTGYVNAIDPFTGTSLASPYFDSNGDGKVDENDSVTAADGTVVPVGSVDLGVGMPTLPTLIDKLLVVGGSKGTLGSVVMNPQGGSARRISWREILRD